MKSLDVPEEALVLRRAFTDAKSDLSEKERTALQVVSSSAVDSYNTIIDARGMDLSAFKRNPVVLWGHRYNEPPVGSDEDIWYEEQEGEGKGRIVARTKYAETARAEEIWQLKRQGHLKAASITFVPTVTKNARSKDWKEVLARYGFEPGGEGAPAEIYTRSVLIEHSDVSLGANPDALLVSVSRGLTLSDEMRKTLGLQEPKASLPSEREVEKPKGRNVTREIERIIARMKGRLV